MPEYREVAPGHLARVPMTPDQWHQKHQRKCSSIRCLATDILYAAHCADSDSIRAAISRIRLLTAMLEAAAEELRPLDPATETEATDARD